MHALIGIETCVIIAFQEIPYTWDKLDILSLRLSRRQHSTVLFMSIAFWTLLMMESNWDWVVPRAAAMIVHLVALLILQLNSRCLQTQQPSQIFPLLWNKCATLLKSVGMSDWVQGIERECMGKGHQFQRLGFRML